MDDTYDDFDAEVPEGFARFLRDAVGEILRTEDPEALFAWLRENGPVQAPEMFGELRSPESLRGFSVLFGRSLWNHIPLPGNGFRPRPIPWPERNEPCVCGSGTKFKKCCAEMATGLSEPDSDAVWRLVVDELSLEQVEALGESGRVPRAVVGDLATAVLDDGDPERAVALVRPLFDRADRLDERDAAALNTYLEALEELELVDERDLEVERLGKMLRPVLRGVLWENLVRSRAVAGDMEGAWEFLEKARKDNPRSPALGPLEVSLLLAEGKMAEAGERARYWRERLRGSDLTEEGFRYLDRVAADPEKAQVEFSLGEEVAVHLRQLEETLARTPPRSRYTVEDSTGEPGALLLVPTPEIEQVEDRWMDVFAPAQVFDDPDLEPEDWESWDEENAADWLGFLVENPVALDSFVILDEVAEAFEDLAADLPGVADSLLPYLVERGAAILDLALAGRPEPRLERDPGTNDSALNVLSAGVYRARRLGDAEAERTYDARRRALDPEHPLWSDGPEAEERPE